MLYLLQQLTDAFFLLFRQAAFSAEGGNQVKKRIISKAFFKLLSRDCLLIFLLRKKWIIYVVPSLLNGFYIALFVDFKEDCTLCALSLAKFGLRIYFMAADSFRVRPDQFHKFKFQGGEFAGNAE